MLLLPLCYVVYSDVHTLGGAASVYATYLAALCTSIIIYRLSPVHPLAEYPGPTVFKITKLAGAWASWSGHHHLILKSLHDEYGPVVRIGTRDPTSDIMAVICRVALTCCKTGPNDISIVDADAVNSVLGPNGLPKGRCPSYLPLARLDLIYFVLRLRRST